MQVSTPMNFFPPQQSKEYSLLELKEIIEGRYLYLIQHAVYLRRIQNNLVSEDNIREYLQDVFNLKCEINEDFKNKVLLSLISTVNDRLEVCKKLRKFVSNSDNNQAIAMLLLEVDFNLALNNDFKSIQHYSVSQQSRILTAFNSADFYQFLLDSLKKINSDFCKTLQNIYKIIIKKNTVTSSKSVVVDNIASLHFSWDYLGRSLKFDLTTFTMTHKVDVKSQSNNPLPEDLNKKLAVLTMMTTEISRIKNLNKKNINNNIDNKTFLEDNAIAFSKVYPLWKEVNDSFSEAMTKVEEAKNFEKAYRKKRNVAFTEIKSIENQLLIFNITTKKLENLWPEDARLIDIKKSTDLISKKIIELRTLWPEKPDEKLTLTDLADKESGFHEAYLQLLKDVDPLSQIIFSANKDIKDDQLRVKNEQQQKLRKEELKQQEELMNTAKERENFKLAKQKQLEDFKAEVIRRSAEKAKQQQDQSSNIIASSPQITVYKNVAFSELVDQLKPKHLALIKLILQQNSGVTFHKVKNLIVKHLKGRVDEIGNGSSHKRIELNKYYIEIVTHSNKTAQPTEDKIEQSSKAVGGFFKPHGEAHNSEKLCNFNLELVAKTFERAGFSLKLIEEIENKKPNLKAEEKTI